MNQPVKIDAHQHFWHYNTDEFGWIPDDMAGIRRDFGPQDLAPLLQAAGYRGCVAVQAPQTEAETEFLLGLVEAHPFILGVVGWVDLRSPQVLERLVHYSRHKAFKGVRHILQAEEPVFMLQDEFLKGIEALGSLGLTYDLLLTPRHIRAAIELVRQFPQQKFVVDHLAKPLIATGAVSPWEEDMAELAQFPQVFCKISGMVTEAGFGWSQAMLQPYVNAVLEHFGPQRLMLGSDWPVCVPHGGDYGRVMSLAESLIAHLPQHEQAAILGQNAVDFYSLTLS